MKAIKLVQYGSTIGILITVAFLLITGGLIIFSKTPDRIGQLVSLGGVIALFLAPEKLAAFFGPVWKRKQNGRKDEC
jgi:hypothetical protein